MRSFFGQVIKYMYMRLVKKKSKNDLEHCFNCYLVEEGGNRVQSTRREARVH